MMHVDPGQRLRASFGWLNATQFFGALNDNIFKALIVFFMIDLYGPEAALRESAVAMGLFVLPFLLFATLAGQFADRFSKQRIVLGVKMAEVAVMALGVLAFSMGSVAGLCAVLFLMATQSAIFGPSKYGIIPELVDKAQLSRANSFLCALSYLAIVLGTSAAPFLTEWAGHRYVLISTVCLLVAVVGLLCSWRIEYTPPVTANRKLSPFIVSDIWRTLRGIRSDGYLLLAILASAYFLLIGAFIQINLIPYGIEALGLSETGAGYLFTVTAVGIGLGALAAGKLSGENVEFGVVPLGALGITINALLLAVIPGRLPVGCVLVFLTGVSVGLFVVPLNAFIQYRAPKARMGEVLAASGFLGWLGVLAAAVFIQFGARLGMSARGGFLVVFGLTLVLTLVTVKVLPDFLVRFLGLLITKFFYRVRLLGLEHYPAEGPALLVSNHVSFVDALMIGVVRARRVRFMMNREMYENPRFNWLWRIMGIIPISLHDGPKQIVESFKHARRAMDEGFVVCIFAEGAITRTGVPRAFRPGFERILKGSDYPVIPVYLGGLWGSILSHYYGAIRPRWPLGLPYPVTIVFGEPLPPTTTAVEVREAVTELSTRYYESLKPKRRPLGEDFVRVARRNWGRPAITDSTGRRLTYGQTLVSVLALRSLLRPSAETGEKVGILLPPSAGGALVNLALTLDRRIPVNLNYSAPAASVASAADQCGLRTTITSRAFVDRVPGLAVPGRQVFVEDLVDALSPGRKLFALLEALLVPPRALAGRASFSADDLLTVIFSSGSTGEPKGVMLSHHNLFSNIEALRMVLRVTPGDNICGVLPFFHSFGYTGTIWLPLVSGFGVSYHPNPMDVAGVGKCVADNGCTMLLGTPTFLMAYTRRVKPEAFRTLRFVMAGAEKLKPRIADAFEKRFGIRPLEGYGATELSPVAALNVPDVTVARVTQTGAKPGTVGHPLPGVAAKVVDPESGERLGPDQPGLLMIKGPNVMLGYLDRPGDTADVLRDGWYRTGDIAAIDVDGFITITDRLSRFSKIGGEMVPHIAVEEVLQKALKKAHQVLAVTSVPDEKKGERLVVIYTDEAGSEDDLRALVSASDLPNLWKPSAYARVGELPLLGSGKLDLGTLKDLAGAACRPRS